MCSFLVYILNIYIFCNFISKLFSESGIFDSEKKTKNIKNYIYENIFEKYLSFV